MGMAVSRAERKDALEFYKLEARCFEIGPDPARMRPIESECLWAQEVAERT